MSFWYHKKKELRPRPLVQVFHETQRHLESGLPTLWWGDLRGVDPLGSLVGDEAKMRQVEDKKTESTASAKLQDTTQQELELHDKQSNSEPLSANSCRKTKSQERHKKNKKKQNIRTRRRRDRFHTAIYHGTGARASGPEW